MKPALATLFALATSVAAQSPTSTNFESPQAHALALSTDGLRLYAVNTPDHRLAIYSTAQPQRPVLLDEIPVGLEPASVAVRSRTEVWVVNHASDTVSIVDTTRGVVVATLRVGDEPGDVVFAGNTAFVSSMTERAVRVFDATTRKPVAAIPVPGDDPRALLASRDGKSVWVAITRSGNKSTLVAHTLAPPPPKPTNPSLPNAPAQGILVHSDDPQWKSKHGVTLPDHDVVEIDVAARAVRRTYKGVGTILFNLAQRPGTNELWVANTAARNLVRFAPKLKGHAIDSRITRIVTGSSPTVTPVDLNPGLDYTKLPNPTALAKALSQPTDVAFNSSGSEAYIASFGTDRIGVIDARGQIAVIEVGGTPGTKVAPRQKRGPRSLVHHPKQALLYVLNRLADSISVVDTAARRSIAEVAMFDPTAKTIREGRGFLYDAKLSGNGTMSCASCHVDGRHDGLAWDLGDPGGRLFNNGLQQLHPMKGPLLTQTLQGMKGERIFHWRADRPGLGSFNAAFDGLLGGNQLGAADLATFVAYMSDIPFMPNPNRNTDDSLPTTPVGASAKDGERIFRTKNNVGKNGSNQFRCVDCHFNRSGTGNFGYDGLIGQPTKAQQLRGLYKRDGLRRRTAGFGFGADGSQADLKQLLSSTARFNPLTANEKAALTRFLFAFAGDHAPAVGLTRTVQATNKQNTDVLRDLRLLVTQAGLGKCDVVAHGLVGGRRAGFAFDSTTGRFLPDRRRGTQLTLAQLLAQVTGTAVLTVQGVPTGRGRQRGIDRDLDGTLDGDDGRLAYGAPTPACATRIATTANSTPHLDNQQFAIAVTGAPATATGWVLVSARRASLSLGDLRVLADPAVGILLPVVADGRGAVALHTAIPNDPRLIGAQARAQSVMLAPCGRLRAAASAGLELTVQR